jgi:hypothetical protein
LSFGLPALTDMNLIVCSWITLTVGTGHHWWFPVGQCW